MRIAIVNDLRLAIESLRRAVATIPGATVAWIAEDGAKAVAMCAQDRPDVILMDMIMPVMDGVEATRRIMRATPCPILVVTATVEGNANKVFEALGAGALDAVATPGIGPDGRTVNAEALVRKVQALGVIAGTARLTARPAQPPSAPPIATTSAIAPFVAIGVSTGGPQALAIVLKALPEPLPFSVVIVQHIDPTFAPGLSNWLAGETRKRVEIVREGDTLKPNRVLLASTSDHVVIDSSGRLGYIPEPVEYPYRPSVDVFFSSITRAKAAAGVAVLLTGMGRDGAIGLGQLRSAGWHTIAQDSATSVVWGMPGAAVEIGAAIDTLSIGDIGGAICTRMRTKLTLPRGTP